MAVKNAQVSVTTTATLLTQTDLVDGLSLLIRNRGTVTVYLGDASVTSSNGYQLDAGESVGLGVDDVANMAVYAVAASGTQTVHVLQVGR